MTHRASFAINDNDFITEQPDGNITCNGNRISNLLIETKVIQHRIFNSHPDCVICQDNENKALGEFMDGAVYDRAEINVKLGRVK